MRRIIVPALLLGVLIGPGAAGPACALGVGQKAPDFTLAAPGGKQVKLSDLTAHGPVVIYTFIQSFEAALPQFEALHAQVVGVSADHAATLEAFSKQQNLKHLLLSDFRRQMLPAYDAMVTDEKSPIFRYAKRAYFVIDKNGVVKWVKVQENALDLLDPQEVLKGLRESGV
jgi:peroxiredoxin Q/BCP